MLQAWVKFTPEPGAHDTIDTEVDARVEDNEDWFEIIHAEPDGGDGISSSLRAQG